MSKFITIVVRMPSDEAGKASVQQALKLLEPHQTAMSLEDEMTTLEKIEQHPDFEEHIADDARRQVAELHRLAEAFV
ncbi:hypothetical protein KBW71_00085 [Hydrogenophaga aromaticivorans]|uniref:hypothetical protein n=1 Tax=Hydrogenophaga aromaticivorans TaxID=2610898 RepID=UPI001B374E66|nr:hypothetical protein [Hydrogenophaga aromaticivorans]MBQ0916847.1 hypothetical protein [Hydrogenophaga aromaticivorans]